MMWRCFEQYPKGNAVTKQPLLLSDYYGAISSFHHPPQTLILETVYITYNGMAYQQHTQQGRFKSESGPNSFSIQYR